MLTTIKCVDQMFAVENSGMSCLALIFNLSNPRYDNRAREKIGSRTSRLQNMTSHIVLSLG